MLLQVDISLTPDGIWNLLEIIILFTFLGFTLFFLKKWLNDRKAKVMESLRQINLGYAIFFLSVTINQFVYISDSIPGFFPALDYFISNTNVTIYLGVTDFALHNQIFLMVILFLVGLTPIMYPLEKYLQNKPKTPVFKMSLVATILTSIIYMLYFVIGRGLAPLGFGGEELLWPGEISTIPGMIMNVIFAAVTVFTLLCALFLIWNFIVFYLILAIKSPAGPLRIKAILIFLGILMFYGALIIGNGLKSDMTGWPILMGPIGFIVGSLILLVGFNKKVI